MQSRIPWILSLVFALGLCASVVCILNLSSERKAAVAERDKALLDKKDDDEAVAKALAARHDAEEARAVADAAKQQTSELLALARNEAAVAKQQAEDQKGQSPKLQEELATVRKALAEAQRGNGAATAVVPAAPKPLPAAHRAPNGWSVPELLPADTLAVIVARDIPSTIEKAKETGLYKILASPEVERVFRMQIIMARAAIMGGEFKFQEKFSDLLGFVSQGEITFAVLGVDKRTPNGTPLADLMLSVQLGDKAGAFSDEFNKRLDQLIAATNGNLTYKQTPLGNTTITRFKYPDFPSEIACAVCDGTFLVCLGEGRIEKLLAMHEKTKAAPLPALAAGAAPEVIAQVPLYQKALEKAGPDADLLFFANVDVIVKNTILNDPNREITATQRHELEVSGLKEVKAVSYALSVKDAGLKESIFLDVPAASRKGLLGLFDGEGADLSAFYAAPRNSVLAWTFKVNPEQLFEKGVAIAALENPDLRDNLLVALTQIGQQLNLDPKKDLLGALSGQGVFSLSVPYKNAKLALAFPQPMLALRIKDQQGVKRLTAALATVLKEKYTFSETADDDKTITIARAIEPNPDGQYIQFCYVIDKDDVLISAYPLALREELKRRATKGARLEDDADFNLARANLTGVPQTMLYVDAGALLVAAYDIAVPIAQWQNRDAQFDVNALPSAELINRNFGGALLDLNLAADGIIVESYSPTGMLGLLGPVAVAAPRVAQARAANVAAAAAQPMVAVKPRGKEDQKKVATLEALARDLKEYAVEHGGEFPKKLDDMRPKYLQDIGTEIEHIVYIGKQAAENRVVAHSSEKLPGSIAILLQDGTVQNIVRNVLGRVLRDGFNDANKPVKPPKPPEF